MFVEAVHRDGSHRFSKEPVAEIRLLAGLGVEGDAHLGMTVQHRSRVRRDPTQPNLRQVHLIHSELLESAAERGFAVDPGQLGENVTTRGVDLLALPTGAVLALGPDAQVEVTGLRNPCAQIDRFSPGLLKELLKRGSDGSILRLAGVMAVVRRSGAVRAGDNIGITLPTPPYTALQPV